MATFTNKFGLPDALYRAVTFSDYSRGDADISVTGLLAPAQQAYLRQLHEDDIEEDISERLWLLLGSCGHVVMERAGSEPALVEKRLYMPCNGWTVSGQIDSFTDGWVEDFKFTSVWSVIYEPKGRKDYHAQLNLYAALLRYNGYSVKGARINACLRDWQKNDAKKNTRGDYPPIPFKEIEIPLWEPRIAEAFMAERVRVHQEAREGRYTACTDEERWMGKNGPARCIGYCPVATWCEQFQGEMHK